MIRIISICIVLVFQLTAIAAPPNIRFEKNNFGGYNIYQNGKLINRTHANNLGSQNVYGKTGKLEYKGRQFGNSQSFQKNAK